MRVPEILAASVPEILAGPPRVVRPRVPRPLGAHASALGEERDARHDEAARGPGAAPCRAHAGGRDPLASPGLSRLVDMEVEASRTPAGRLGAEALDPEMARANPLWGAPRIHGELLNPYGHKFGDRRAGVPSRPRGGDHAMANDTGDLSNLSPGGDQGRGVEGEWPDLDAREAMRGQGMGQGL